MVDILTGEVEDRERTPEERGVDPAASAMGRRGTVVHDRGGHMHVCLKDVSLSRASIGPRR
jgi:hypothetical protein